MQTRLLAFTDHIYVRGIGHIKDVRRNGDLPTAISTRLDIRSRGVIAGGKVRDYYSGNSLAVASLAG